MKKVLLIAYIFPPYPGIGGRRWAKFAKYLTRKGFEVHVISAKNPYKNKVSLWFKDVANNKSIINYKLKSVIPSFVYSGTQTAFQKIAYRFYILYLKLMVRGNYYDWGGLWKKQLVKNTTDIIEKNNIQNVIVTGAPYHLCYHTCELKKIFPAINLLVDFRDPWTIFNEEWNFGALSEKRKREECDIEAAIIRNADHVITIYDLITNLYKSKFPESQSKFVSVGNGFDSEDFPDITYSYFETNDKIKFVFTGSLYSKMDHLFLPFLNAVALIKEKRFDIYEKTSFEFYDSVLSPYAALSKKMNIDAIRFHDEISLSDVSAKIAQADYCMLFLLRNYEFAFSTKFYEYLFHRKKIILFSEKKGDAEEFIRSHKIGYAIRPNKIYESLIEIVSNHKISEPIQYAEMNIDEFRVDARLNKIIELLK